MTEELISPAVKHFLEDPKPGTFKEIDGLGYALFQVVEIKPDLAKQYFTFENWLELENNPLLQKDEATNQLIQRQLKSSIKNFSDGYRYYYTLDYDVRKTYANELIKLAQTEKDFNRLLSTLDESFADAIKKRKSEVSSLPMVD